MRLILLITSVLFVAVLGGCAQTGQEATRLDAPMLASAPDTMDAARMAQQAEALNRMANDLVRRSSLRGARAGAVVGCGLAVVSAGNPRACVVGAATSGLAGAAVGQRAGRQQVNTRVELVSANALVRSIRGMNGQMQDIRLGLPDLLAEQDAELNDLALRRDTGAITQADYAAGVGAIRESRAMIAAALGAAGDRADMAQANLAEVSAQGQSGLEWHIGATAQMARDAHSARSQITLL